MILQALNDLYTRLAEDPAYGIAPPGFSPQKISFRIVIRPDGSLVAIEDARDKGAKGRSISRRLEVPLHEKRTSGIKPQFLCDKPEYLLGTGGEFGEKCFAAFKAHHLALESQINSPEFSAICAFLKQWTPTPESFSIPPEVCANFGVWKLQGSKRDIHESVTIRDWWIRHRIAESGGATGQCLVSGSHAPICRIHPDIKGFKSSVALIGIQEKTSYESYGLSKTENCPISEEVAFRYATALNSLLDGPLRNKHRVRLCETSVVFWTERPTLTEDIFAGFFSSGEAALSQAQDEAKRSQIQRLLDAIRSGGSYREFGEAETPFFILGLEQPNPGRFSIRFFHRSTIREIIARLHDHHECLRIVRQFTETGGKRQPDPEFPPIWQILRETARDADDIPPLLAGALARSVLEGTPYPEALFAAIIRRIHADRNINYLRAATLKAILTRNHQQTVPVMLDIANTNTAYLLGRLFAALEKTQEDALGSVNAGIRDRYYSAASATPGAVFPRLLRTYPHHLSKLTGGSKTNREKLFQEIFDPISANGFPKHLPLKEQGIFAIGYYHQRKDFFTSKKETETTTTES